MNHFPDFSAYGFQIRRELGRNPSGGRVTYLAQTSQSHPVVLKQFQFAKGGDWTGFKAIDRETQTLKDLQHPGIPRYLGTFETDDGFCLVQEYKEARPLSEPRSFSPDEVKHIATALLEILVYLQERIPPVFHRDIKPENVLVSDDLQVYLIDFGFARIGGDNLTMSSVAMGTFGFMAPEQSLNRQLTPASDLYGLGLTLVCVIAQLKSHEIGEYVDYSNQLDQKAIESKLKGCSLRFIEWLNQMVAPDPKKRFPDAATALAALKPLYVKRTPEVKLNPSSLHFKVINKIKEKQTKAITLTNSIPETILKGSWKVVAHDSDPPQTSWVSFSPQTIQGNEVICEVTVDTSYFQSEKQGNRELIFGSNAEQEEVRVRLSYEKLAPNVQINPPSLNCTATKLGEKITQTITLTNSIPETILEGYWAVAPHPKDPPHTPDEHSWISFSPKTVKGNQVSCTVKVDTSQLQTDRKGSRELVFHSNAEQEKAIVRLQVKTAHQLVPQSGWLYFREFLYSGITAINGGILVSLFVLVFQAGALALVRAIAGALALPKSVAESLALALAGIGGLAVAVAKTLFRNSDVIGIEIGLGILFGGLAGAVVVILFGGDVFGILFGGLAGAVAGVVAVAVAVAVGILVWSVVRAVTGVYILNTLDRDYKKLPPSDQRSAWVRFWIRFVLALCCGGGIGAGITLGFTANLLIPLGSLGTGAGLVYVSMLPMLTHRRQLAAQRRKEHYLIEP